jgi:hypothetical protein
MVLLLVVLVGMQFNCADQYNYKRDYANQEIIAKAYIKFVKDRRVFPQSLEVLVSGGYLPENGCFYQPVPRRGCEDDSYRDSSYEVFVPEAGEIESLRMIARRVKQNGRDAWEFEPMINALIRDEIRKLRGSSES